MEGRKREPAVLIIGVVIGVERSVEARVASGFDGHHQHHSLDLCERVCDPDHSISFMFFLLPSYKRDGEAEQDKTR